MAIRSASLTALGAGLLLALAASPAAAKKPDDASAGPALNPSKEARPALAALQEAMKNNDMATAKAKLADAQAAIHNDDDKYFVGQFGYKIAQSSNDLPGQLSAIELMIQSGKSPPSQQPSLYAAAGQLAFQTNNYAKSDQYLTQAVTMNPADTQLPELVFEAKLRENKTAEGLAYMKQAIDKAHAAGQKPPKEWYGRPIGEGYKAKIAEPTGELTLMWVKDYPTLDDWRDSITIFRATSQVDPDTNLDTLRLLRALGALKGHGDYVEYADAVYLRYPNEAKTVLDEGVKAGEVNLAAGNAKEDYDSAAKRLAADKASLASAPTGTGKQALNVADAYSSYGDYAKAASLYQQAITKGGVDPAVANTRLAFALARQGQKDAAKQALAKVTTGPRATLARFMEVWIDQMA